MLTWTLRHSVVAAMAALGWVSLQPQANAAAPASASCRNNVHANVVSLEQAYAYNRYGAFNPGGLIYTLRRDVVQSEAASPGASSSGEDATAAPAISSEPDLAHDCVLAGRVTLRGDKRPRPLVLRVNEGDCLEVRFTNLLTPMQDGENPFTDPVSGRTTKVEAEEPATRRASMHVNGLEYAGGIGFDGVQVGRNPSSLVAPGEMLRYLWYGRKEGGYLLYSMGRPAGGEGDGGRQGFGLFSSLKVEPAGSACYRSQVTGEQLAAVTPGMSPLQTPVISYKLDADGVNGRNATGRPLLPILDRGASCGQPFREFTGIFHDKLTVQQAYPQLQQEENPISSMRDGMGINYGAQGLGTMVLANRVGASPAADCKECKLEEFSSYPGCRTTFAAINSAKTM